MTRLRPFFPYFGSKWSLAPAYPDPEYEVVVEPFAGSACYSLLHADRQVVVNDRNPDVVAIWRFLVDASRDDVMSLPDVRYGTLTNELGLPPGAAELIGRWGNPASEGNQRYFVTDRGAEAWSTRSRRRIADQLAYIRHWTVLQGSYADLDVSRPATWFVDPPYQRLPAGYGGAFKVNYKALGAWCEALPGQAIVCEQDGATWLPFRDLALYQAQRGLTQIERIWP